MVGYELMLKFYKIAAVMVVAAWGFSIYLNIAFAGQQIVLLVLAAIATIMLFAGRSLFRSL